MGVSTSLYGDGIISKYKEILVEEGLSQVHGIYYNETFAPTANMDSIRLILFIATTQQWELHHMDVNSAFLHGDLSEDIFVQIPKIFVWLKVRNMGYV